MYYFKVILLLQSADTRSKWWVCIRSSHSGSYAEAPADTISGASQVFFGSG